MRRLKSPNYDVVASYCLYSNIADYDFSFDDEHENVDNEIVFSVPDCEKDGLEYFLGYIVFKFHKNLPFLEGSSDIDATDWISFINRGYLKRMLPEYIDQFNLMEKSFRDFHGQTNCSVIPTWLP